MLSATWRICFFEWVRALRAQGFRRAGVDLLDRLRGEGRVFTAVLCF